MVFYFCTFVPNKCVFYTATCYNVDIRRARYVVCVEACMNAFSCLIWLNTTCSSVWWDYARFTWLHWREAMLDRSSMLTKCVSRRQRGIGDAVSFLVMSNEWIKMLVGVPNFWCTWALHFFRILIHGIYKVLGMLNK